MITIYDSIPDAEIIEAVSNFGASELASAMSQRFGSITIYTNGVKVLAITQDASTIDMLQAYAGGWIDCWYATTHTINVN